jgi:hypothetical protein
MRSKLQLHQSNMELHKSYDFFLFLTTGPLKHWSLFISSLFY